VGVTALVYGFIRAASNGWGDHVTLAAFGGAAALVFLPMTIALFSASRLAPRLMPRAGTKPLMIAGMLPAIASMSWLWRVTPATGYWSGVFGPRHGLRRGITAATAPGRPR
jgi:hypothetical protein